MADSSSQPDPDREAMWKRLVAEFREEYKDAKTADVDHVPIVTRPPGYIDAHKNAKMAALDRKIANMEKMSLPELTTFALWQGLSLFAPRLLWFGVKVLFWLVVFKQFGFWR